MKCLLIGVSVIAFAGVANAQTYGSQGQGYLSGTGSNPNSHYVQPHMTNQGSTYTPGHYQTNPTPTQTDNYGARNNVNPYTGHTGTRSVYR